MQITLLRFMVTGALGAIACQANATLMNVEIGGYVNGKPSSFLNTTSVNVGDVFTLNFTFDDGQSSSSQVTVNGNEIYTVVTQPFSPALLSWSGSMPSEVAQYNTPSASGGLDGWGTAQSWYRPVNTLHHTEWEITSGSYSGNSGRRGFDIYIVTNFAGDLGYGWWSIGSSYTDSANAIDYGFLDVTSLSITPVTTVPEPGTLALFGLGLAGLGFIRRKNS